MKLYLNLLENNENDKARPKSCRCISVPTLREKFKHKVAFACEMVANCVQHQCLRSQWGLWLSGQYEKQNLQVFSVRKEKKLMCRAGTKGQKCPFIQIILKNIP